MSWKTLSQMDLKGKRVLTRVDLNVPIIDGKVSDATRIEKIVPTVNEIIKKGGTPILLSHMGRPKGERNPNLSLSQLQEKLENYFKSRVVFVADCIGPSAETALKVAEKGQIILLENTRFHPEEEENDPEFAASLATLADIFCNDAFSASHRAHASTTGLAKYLPSCAGNLMESELKALESVLVQPERPVATVVGGAKISTKITLLINLLKRVDFLVIGGAMANTFLLEKGYKVGKSLVEKDKTNIARQILDQANENNCTIILPTDVVTSKSLDDVNSITSVGIDEIDENMIIYDIGEKTIEEITNTMASCKTIFWNGPLGVYEREPFDNSTNVVGRTAAILTKGNIITSVAGGGDTVAALNNSGVAGGFSYVSIAGGALVEWLEGKKLPGLNFLENS